MKLNEIVKAGDLYRVQDYKSGDLDIRDEYLISLEGCPKEIAGYFNCDNNKLTSLKGVSENISGYFSCESNQLSSFEYFPRYISSNCYRGNCYISYNKFTSFKDIDQHIEFIGETLFASGMNITSGFSDLFGIDGLKRIEVSNKQIEDIVNKYLPDRDMV